MNQQTETRWDIREKEIAQTALKKAYRIEVETLVQEVKDAAGLIASHEDVWQLHDFLSGRRHDIEGKYDEREEFLMYTLSRLIKDGLLEISDLDGIDAGKKAKINLLTRM